MKMLKLEVRCCCDPTKLWGFIDVVEQRLLVGDKYLMFNIRNETMEEGFSRVHEPQQSVSNLTHVVLELATITYLNLTEGVALKSRDYAIELLRLLPGFKEATPEEQERGKEIPVSTDGKNYLLRQWRAVALLR